MPLVCQPNEKDAEQRSFLQVERLVAFIDRRLLGFAFGIRFAQVTEVQQWHWNPQSRSDLQDRIAIHFVNARAQRFMALDDGVDRTLQHRNIQWSVDAKIKMVVVMGSWL